MEARYRRMLTAKQSKLAEHRQGELGKILLFAASPLPNGSELWESDENSLPILWTLVALPAAVLKPIFLRGPPIANNRTEAIC